MPRRHETGSGGRIPPDLLYDVLDLADEDVQFERRFGFDRVGVGHDDIREEFTETARPRGLLFRVGLFVQRDEVPLERADLRERLDDGERRFGRAPALEHRREHVEAFLGEGLVVVFRMGAPVCAFGL